MAYLLSAVMLLYLFLGYCILDDRRSTYCKLQETPPAWAAARLNADFAFYKDREVSLAHVEDLFQRRGAEWLLAKFTICHNKVTAQKNSSDPSIDCRIDAFLRAFQYLSFFVPLPDMVFLICMHDALGVTPDDLEGVPIYAMAKSEADDRIILLPDFEALLDNVKLHTAIAKGARAYPWDKKVPLAIWRGATTGPTDHFLALPRSFAIQKSLERPDLIDARYTAVVQFEDVQAIKNDFAPFFGSRLSVKDQLKYKYQLLIDGNSCAYSRAYWQLFSGCLMFKSASSSIQWYHGALHPYTHYVPLKHDFADLIEKITWAQQHDGEAFKIACNAQQLARNILEFSAVYQYLYLALQKYATLNIH